MTTPEQIQRDIEGTRSALSNDVDLLAEKVSPSRVVGRRVERVKSGASSMRERIMGTLPDPSDVKGRVSGTAGSVAGSASSAADSAKDAVTAAPRAVRQQAQGNPLGAGLVAFGVGLVLSSMIPASEPEKQFAAKAEDLAVEPLQEKAKEVAGQLQDSARDSAEQLKETATSAATQTMEQAQSSAQDVQAPFQQ